MLGPSVPPRTSGDSGSREPGRAGAGRKAQPRRALRPRRLGRAVCLVLLAACCSAAPAGADFYWSSPGTNSIFRADRGGPEPMTLVTGGSLGSAVLGGVAVGAGHIFWVWEEGIGRANLDGSAPNTSFITGIEGITDVTVSGNHIYWSGGGGRLGRANVDGSEVEPNFITGVPGGSVDGVAVGGEYVYWTNFWSSAIGRAKLNGSEVEQEWVVGTHTPEGLAVSAPYLYWAITYENHIGRVRLDGTELTTNFITTGLSSGANQDVGIAVYGQHIYWANPTTGTIGRANINGTEVQPDFITEAGSPLDFTVVGPDTSTLPASEVTSSAGTLNGEVNPVGVEVEQCVFEYGTTTSYGSSVPCSPMPAAGESPVSVSAALTGLTPNTVYHYRLVAESSQGVSAGEDATFTTLESSATGEASKVGETAKATDGELSVEASGGTGAVTIGHYGSNIGGPPMALGHGAYFQVYRSTGSTFTRIEYEDCELGGAKALWWDNVATGWEPIREPVALYDEATKCVKVAATETTTPSVAQLADPRHVGGPAASEQLGKCVPAKHGHFEGASCVNEKYTEKNGVRTYKGKYEWYAAPVGCFAAKHGHYAEGTCGKEVFSENKKTHEKKYKGKYEKGANSFSVTGGSIVIAVTGQPSVECAAAKSTSGLMRAANQGTVTLALTGCERNAVKCASRGEESGTIVSGPLETYSYEEAGERFSVLAAETMLSFTCSGTEFRLSGAAAGQLNAAMNAPISSIETTFSQAVGAQELELEETKTDVRRPATLTTNTTISTEQPVEIKAKS